MFVDASALVAVLLDEDDAPGLVARLEASPDIFISPIVRFETAAALARARSGAVRPDRALFEAAVAIVDRLIAEIGATTVPISDEIGALALEAAARFGKVTGHQADLNLGDCFAYGCCRALGLGLLFKGNDFALTDIEPA